MMGTKEICAILLAGSMGAGSVVAVQKVKTVSAKAAAKPKGGQSARAPRPRAIERTTPGPAAPRILDCPVGSPFSAEPNPFVLPDLMPPGFGGNIVGAPFAPVVWGGGGLAPVTPPPPMIAEPGAWAMMIAGFGFVGLSLRRRTAAA